MAGIFAHGVTLTVGSAIAEVTSVSGPTYSADTIDVTTHDSADSFREFVAGLRDAGEISVEGNFIDATGANVLIDLLAAGTVTSGATIEVPLDAATATFTFDCIVTAYEASFPHEDKASFTATLKVTGKPTLAQV